LFGQIIKIRLLILERGTPCSNHPKRGVKREMLREVGEMVRWRFMIYEKSKEPNNDYN
jgi:hypothetical protein